MRIGVALIVIADLFIRSSDLTAHYTDEGVWPIKYVSHLGWKNGYWSIHHLFGSFYWSAFLFALHFVFAFGLLLGYQTKICNLAVWILTISLHNRNLYILQAGDDVLRLVLLWGLFLPWNHYMSFDSRKKKPTAPFYWSYFGYLMLLASIYFFTVNLKTSDEWHKDGSAIYYALSLDQLRLPYTGDFLYNYPQAMKWLTWFVFYAELIIPFLILFPDKSGKFRLTAFILLIFIHVGIGLTLYVGLFFIINLITAIGLIPDFVWKKTAASINLNRSKTKHSRPLIFNRLIGVTCLTIITLCLVINLGYMRWFPYQLNQATLSITNALRIDQYWGMFSPFVLKKDGWLIYHGIDNIGRQHDLRNDCDYVDYTKPKHVVSLYKTDRWRKLAENMQNENHTFLRPLFCKYVLKSWNNSHPEKHINTLNLFFMEEETLPNYKSSGINKQLYCVCNEQ